MVRTQVQLKEHQLEALKARAASEQVSVSELVRRAVDLLTQIESLTLTEEKRRRAVAVAGRFASGLRDVAEKHDDYLAEAYRP